MSQLLMERLFLILAFITCAFHQARGQSLSVDDVVKFTSLSPKSYDECIARKGFAVKRRTVVDNSMGFVFYPSKTSRKDSVVIQRSIDLYKKNDTWCIALHTTSADEFEDGKGRLLKMGFYSNPLSDTGNNPGLLFQKKAITVETRIEEEDSIATYTFLVTKKEIPAAASIRYADDLLRFDSHEYLVSCYGESNVKKDVYIFSANEKKKCSVLFPNTDEQAVFIWEDETNYRKISYVLISGTISTPDGKDYNGSFSHNKWELKNGIYQGMRISDLLRLNSNDFTFFGNKSEFSMMVEPKVTGSINFKWIGIGFNCFNCDRAGILDKQKVSASDAVNNNLAMHISCIMITP